MHGGNDLICLFPERVFFFCITGPFILTGPQQRQASTSTLQGQMWKTPPSFSSSLTAQVELILFGEVALEVFI